MTMNKDFYKIYIINRIRKDREFFIYSYIKSKTKMSYLSYLKSLLS